jgi:Cys-tRNA synthase (O-phospho-L-seryl-tRNA:Cys-tRNA synthase)
LTALENWKSELEENKKLIAEIKNKWQRVICGVRNEYHNLESFEKENQALMRKKRKRGAAMVEGV